VNEEIRNQLRKGNVLAAAAAAKRGARSDGKTVGEVYGDPGARCSAETDHLLASKANADRLRRSIAEASSAVTSYDGQPVICDQLPPLASKANAESAELLKLAERLEDFADNGVFTAQRRWQSVVDAAAALRRAALALSLLRLRS